MSDQVQQIIEKLKVSDRGVVKASLIEDLGKLGDHRAIHPLISALNDEDTLVRWNAIQALAQFGADSIAPLIRALDSDDRFARRNVVQALGEIGGDETVACLIRMLMFDEQDKNVLIEVIRALHKITPARAVEPLITVLKMTDWEMKWRAIHTLGKIGDTAAIEPLLMVMNDEDPDIRWAASVAIENIKRLGMKDASCDTVKCKTPDSIPAATPPPPASAPSEMNLTTSVKGGGIIIHVEGDINYTNAATFRGFVEGVISASSGPVSLDLGNCHFVDSYGLSQFNTIRRKLKSKNRALIITGLDANLKTLFEATKLNELFEIG
ncbi:MAG: HEAT repeat domain-containing protein [bacterium]